MSHKGNTETFYREIINKLTEKMKDEYNNEGIGEDTLLLMKKKWEEKLIQQGIFIPRPTQMAYLKHSFNNRAFINHIEKTVPFNTFKSAPSNTTTDNIKSYIESKNNSIQQQYPMNQVAQPRFYTSTQQLMQPYSNNGMMNQNLTSMIADYPKQIQEGSKEIKKVIENNEEIKEENDKDKESVDSEYEIFNQVKNQKGNKEEENNHEQKEDDDETLSPLSNDSEEQEIEAKDFLLAQYEKVHRVRNKWKITFKDAVLHFNGKEYVFDKVVGELDRDW